MLFLKNIDPPTQLDHLFESLHENYKVDMSLFKNIKGSKLNPDELPGYIKDLMDLLGILINIIDKMVIK